MLARLRRVQSLSMDVPYELFLDELHNHDRLIYKQTRLALNKKIHIYRRGAGPARNSNRRRLHAPGARRHS